HRVNTIDGIDDPGNARSGNQVLAPIAITYGKVADETHQFPVFGFQYPPDRPSTSALLVYRIAYPKRHPLFAGPRGQAISTLKGNNLGVVFKASLAELRVPCGLLTLFLLQRGYPVLELRPPSSAW